MSHSTPSAEALQPCKNPSVFIRAFDHISPDILNPLEDALAGREDLKPGPGRPRCPSRSLLRAHLMFKYPGLITRYKMVELERNLLKKAGRIYDALQLCGFNDIPSYSTFRRTFGVLDRDADLVDAALGDISRVLKNRPWVVTAEKAEKAREKAGDKEDIQADPNEYVRRQRENRCPDAEIESVIYKTSPEEFARREVETRAWFLEQWWPNGCPRCPHCPSEKIGIIASGKPAPYRCKGCDSYFSERTGTIMQDSKVPYTTWLECMRDELRVKGESALQTAYKRGIPHNTALNTKHKILYCLQEAPQVAQGWLQIDGTLIGGLEENKHQDKRLRNRGGPEGKIPVIVARDTATGRSHLIISDEAATPELEALMRALLPLVGAVLVSDGHKAHKSVLEKFKRQGSDTVHLFVNHSSKTGGRYRDKLTDEDIFRLVANRCPAKDGSYREQYCGEELYYGINECESVNKELKTALMGIYGHVTRAYLPLYLNEIMWRHNHRWENDLEQLKAIARNMPGRTLTVEEMRRNAKDMLGKEPHQPELLEDPAEPGKKFKAKPRQPEPPKVVAGAGEEAEVRHYQLRLPLEVVAESEKQDGARPRKSAPLDMAA